MNQQQLWIPERQIWVGASCRRNTRQLIWTATAIFSDTNQSKLERAAEWSATWISIERLNADSWTYQVVAQISDATSYIDTNLTLGMTYYYRVRACNLAAW